MRLHAWRALLAVVCLVGVTELPEALEQKVRTLRQMQNMKVEIELLRSQLW